MEAEHVSGVITRSAGGGADRSVEPEIHEVEIGYESIDHAHQSPGCYIVINTRRQERGLPTIYAFDKIDGSSCREKSSIFCRKN